MRRCIHALGNMATPQAKRYLEEGERGFDWHPEAYGIKTTSYAFALRKHRLIEELGLERMIRSGHSGAL